MGRSKKSFFRLENNTNLGIIDTNIHGVDNYDWDGSSRPDRNLKHLKIPPKGHVERRQELNYYASNCPFTMTLTFSDGSIDEFRVYQKHAVGGKKGFKPIKQSHDFEYDVNSDVLIVKVKNTAQQLQNEKAEEKNKEGEAMMKNQQYEAAMKLFDVALSMANHSSTINSIKKNKSEACTQIGKTDFKDALILEEQDKPEDAKTKFEKAEKMFQQATNLNNSADCQQNSKMVALKIEGNKLFNEGNDLEKEASTSSDAAQNKYKEALDKYEKAAQKFEEGAKLDARFDDSVKVTKEVMESLKKVVSEIDEAVLMTKINEVHVDEEKQEEETVEVVTNTNFTEQVDVVVDLQ